MAGTMPHAIFIETGLDSGATAVAYAAELPGCAVFAADPDAAAQAMPRRVARFTAWLRAGGEPVPTFVGDNWYEVERSAAGDGVGRRAAFSLDELPPSAAEFSAWLRWLELAREELAAAIDASPPETSELEAIRDQDLAYAAELGSPNGSTGGDASGDAGGDASGDALDGLYRARDLLTDALLAAGPSGSGVRRILRLAIADDLRLAERLRSGSRPTPTAA